MFWEYTATPTTVFLFILGMAIPLALQARIKKGHRIPAISGTSHYAPSL